MSQKIKIILLSLIIIAFGYIFCVGHAAIAAPVAKATSALGNDCSSGTADECLNKNPIIRRLNEIIKVLSGLVGVLVIGMIIVGGIQYAIAGDNAAGVTAAKHRIINALIALVVYIFMVAFLQWLIPGGII